MNCLNLGSTSGADEAVKLSGPVGGMALSSPGAGRAGSESASASGFFALLAAWAPGMGDEHLGQVAWPAGTRAPQTGHQEIWSRLIFCVAQSGSPQFGHSKLPSETSLWQLGQIKRRPFGCSWDD